MSRDHALPEYMMFGAKTTEDLDGLAERAVTLGDQAQRIGRASFPLDAPGGKFRVDDLVDRFRANQEA